MKIGTKQPDLHHNQHNLLDNQQNTQMYGLSLCLKIVFKISSQKFIIL